VAVLVDTSALYALIDDAERMHRTVRTAVEQCDEPLLVPITVVPEADYLVLTRLGAATELAMLRALETGELDIEGVTAKDFARAVELVGRYADSDLGFVDASIAAIERLRIRRILTLDRRHFGMLRPRHCPAFDLLP